MQLAPKMARNAGPSKNKIVSVERAPEKKVALGTRAVDDG
jgi:hypothetical protein